jgi:hypothetical protein
MKLIVLSIESTPPFPMYESTSFLSVLVPDTAHISKFLWEGFVTFVKSNAKALLTPEVSKMQTRKRVLRPRRRGITAQ